MMVRKRFFAVAILSLSVAVAPSMHAMNAPSGFANGIANGFAAVKNKAAGLVNTVGRKAVEIGVYAYTNGWKTGAVLGGVAAVTGLAVYAVKKLTKPQQERYVHYEYTSKCARAE